MNPRDSGRPQLGVTSYPPSKFVILNTSQPLSQQQPYEDPDRYAKEMQDVNSYGHRAMKILEQKLADAAKNEKHITDAQNATKNTGKQPSHLPQYAMPAMTADTQAVQAPDPAEDNNETAGASEYMTSQFAQPDAALNNPNAVNNGGKNMDQAGPASPHHHHQQQQQQQQDQHNNTMLSAQTGALTIASSSYNGGQGGRRDIFSNDHLTSEIVPLEDPAEVYALSQSTVPLHIRNGRSKQLNLLTCGPNQLPTAAFGLCDENFPFMEGARLSQPTPNYGVIRLFDIPENTRRNEILAVMGRNSRVLNDREEPVHIIIERVNAATREAYVEFLDEKSALDVIAKFDRAQRDGRTPRLGEHPLRYELSSQAALMKALFPQAKGVRWVGAVPHVLPDDHTKYDWERFKGFISVEEMACLAKHGESNKSYSCPQRPYECMISTLRKMPYYMTQHITFHQRYAMFDATMRLIRSLQRQIRFRNSPFLLNEQLLERLWVSAILCPGFSVAQKDDVAFVVGLSEERMRDFDMPRFADKWNHTHTLAPKPGVTQDVLEWYIAIIRETTTEEIMRLPPQVLQEIRRLVGNETLYWGYYWKILRLEDVVGSTLDNMSLAELASREFFVISGILSLAFGGQHPGLSQQQPQYQQQHPGPVGPNNQAGFGHQQQQQHSGAVGPYHQTGFVQQQELADPFQQQPAQPVNGGQQFGPVVQGVHGGHIGPLQQMPGNGSHQFSQGFQGARGGYIDPFQQMPANGGQQPGQGGRGGRFDPFQQHSATGGQQHPVANGSQQFGNGVQVAHGSQGVQGGQ